MSITVRAADDFRAPKQTRLERFCESLVADVLHDFIQANTRAETIQEGFAAARAVAERRIRGFVVSAWATAYSLGYTQDESPTANDYLDEPTP